MHKKYQAILLLITLVLPVPATALTMSSPGYSINGSGFTSGGSSAIDATGASKSGIAIGKVLYIPSDSTASSPNYSIKQVAQVSPGGGGGFLHTGDINGDGVVDVIDALLALKTGIGLVQLTANERERGDVGPLVHGVPVGDGRIDSEDSMLILRKAVGLSW